MNANFLRLTNSMALWLIVAACFSINLPIAFGSISLGLFLIFWLISGGYKAKYHAIINNPGALVALGLIALYGLGISYSSASLQDSVHYFLKYSKLLLIPLMVGLAFSDRYRKYAINAFLISLIGYLAVSYLNWFGIFSLGPMHHGTYMAIGLYLMLGNVKKSTGEHKAVWLILAAFTIFDILVITDVRTGVVTMSVLIVLFCYENWGRKSLLVALGAFLLVAGLFQIFPFLKEINPRLMHIDREVAEHSSDKAPTSAGLRIEMYKNTLQLIQKHPILGGGTGSLKDEYAYLVKDTNAVFKRVTNPHNQFLATTQDLGIVGLFALLAFWLIHWKQSFALANPEYGRALRAIIVATVIGSLFNSLLLDSGDGRMYCLLAGLFLSAYRPKSLN